LLYPTKFIHYVICISITLSDTHRNNLQSSVLGHSPSINISNTERNSNDNKNNTIYNDEIVSYNNEILSYYNSSNNKNNNNRRKRVEKMIKFQLQENTSHRLEQEEKMDKLRMEEIEKFNAWRDNIKKRKRYTNEL